MHHEKKTQLALEGSRLRRSGARSVEVHQNNILPSSIVCLFVCFCRLRIARLQEKMSCFTSLISKWFTYTLRNDHEVTDVLETVGVVVSETHVAVSA